MMRCVGILLLTTAALAADLKECSGPGICSSSLLQHFGTVASKQHIEREKRRQDTFVDVWVERRLIIMAGLVLEGMDQADAISTMRSLAESHIADDWKDTDLASDESEHVLFLKAADSSHQMVCHVRQKEGDCEQEWRDFFHSALVGMAQQTASLLESMVGGQAERQVLSVYRQGKTDGDLLELAKSNLISGMKVMVKKGEDPEAVKQTMADVSSRLMEMEDSALLKHVGKSRAGLAKVFALNIIKATCISTTDSCSEALVHLVLDLMAQSEGTITSALMQASARPTVQLVMKILGIPEFPEETAEERRVASKAYLAQREILSN